MSSRPASGGGRWVEVPPARLARWIDNFTARHGAPVTGPVSGDDDPASEGALLLAAVDGATAVLYPPAGARRTANLPDFLAEALVARRLALLLVRKGGVAVGVAAGDELVVSKVESRYVQGRTAAGGWSQQRFARRRENQAKALLTEATELAVRVLLPQAPTVAALVCGGDRRAVETILADRRLAPLAVLRAPDLLDVPEPRHAVLVEAADRARAVRILVREPAPAGSSAHD